MPNMTFLIHISALVQNVQNVVTVTKPRILKTVESIISVYLNFWENEERRENV